MADRQRQRSGGSTGGKAAIMGYRLLATLLLATHFVYLAYVVIGGFLAWRWPRTIWLHLAAAAWGALVVVATLPCPLTYAEDWARRQGGETPLTKGFVDRYIEGVVYPAQYTGVARALAAAVVLTSWIGMVVINRRRARAPAPATTSAVGRASGSR
jgi:hypothetical protein